MKPNNKVVIITGASSGIGWATAQLAAAQGYRLVLSARREQQLNDLATLIRSAGGEAHVVTGDISQLETQQRIVSETVDRYGRIDILINNAGFPLPASFASPRITPELLYAQWTVNVTTLSTLTRLALPYLQRTSGTVINIGSSISRFPVPSMGNYAPTKVAVAALSSALLLELAPLGVKVCLVEPGPIATEFTFRAGGDPARAAALGFPASHAARAIVRLFKHPRRRIVIPTYLGPLLLVAGYLDRLLQPIAEHLLLLKASLSRPK